MRRRKVKELVQSHTARTWQRQACSRDPAGFKAGALLTSHPAPPALCAGGWFLRHPLTLCTTRDTHTCKPHACNVNPKPELEGWNGGGRDGYEHQ